MNRTGDTEPNAPEIARAAFHELNNHLNVALLNTSMLQRRFAALDPAATRQLEMLSRSLDSVRILTCQLRDLIDLLQQGSGLDLGPLELASVLEEAADQSMRRAGFALENAAGVRVLGQRAWTVRLFSTFLDLTPAASLAFTPEVEAVRFTLQLPVDVESPGAREMSLALGEQLVSAHRGTWRAVRGLQQVAVEFTLPAAR